LLKRGLTFSDIGQILLSHEILFSSINSKDYLRSSLRLTTRTAQLFQVKAIRESLKMSRNHNDSQASLRSAMSLSKLVDSCASLGLKIDAAANFDLANVLWDLGEMTTSIRILQEISQLKDLHKQSLPVSRAEVLASLVSNNCIPPARNLLQ
jgi:ataxia telangiectasia mutated family protein